MSGQPRWIRPLGDTGPALELTCRVDPVPGQRVGAPFDLTPATAVVATVRRWSDRAVVQSAAATITSPATAGTCMVPLTTMISTSPGLHAVTITVTTPTEQRTFPGPLDPAWLLIAEPLGGAAPVTVADPGAPVVIAPSGTGGPTVNGQLVFAGASSTITLPADVSWCQVAWSGAGDPWTSATVPTIQQAGSTVAAGTPAQLLASGGNLVIVTKVGTVLTALSTGRATIWAYNGVSYGPDPDARLIEQGTGNPAPTGLVDNDILLQQDAPGTGGGPGYLHTQSVADTVWTVNHNLGVLTPSVTLADGSGLEFLAQITFVTVNQLTVTSSAAIAGTAYIQA